MSGARLHRDYIAAQGPLGPTPCCPPMPAPTPLPPWALRAAPVPSNHRSLSLPGHRSPGTGATAAPRAAPAVRCGPRGRGFPAGTGADGGPEERRSFERGERGRDRERFPARSSTFVMNLER